jgi:hypothetical protein
MASSVSGLLSSIGLGPPNPAEYSDASAVASQTTSAVSGLAATNSSIGLAVSGLKMMGVPAETLAPVENLQRESNTLLAGASNMSPSAIAAQNASLQARLIATNNTAISGQFTKLINDMRAMETSVTSRMKVVEADKAYSKETQASFKTLKEDVTAAVKILTDGQSDFVKQYLNAAQGTGGSGSATLPTFAGIPETTSVEEFQLRLDTLNSKADSEKGEYSPTVMWKNWLSWFKIYVWPWILTSVIVFSMILGGSIMSNMYLETEKEWIGNRLFYFVYGAIAFPISLLVGCVKPPYWVAWFPAYARSKPVTVPTQVGGAFGFNLNTLSEAVSSVSPAAAQTLGGAASSLPTMPALPFVLPSTTTITSSLPTVLNNVQDSLTAGVVAPILPPDTTSSSSTSSSSSTTGAPIPPPKPDPPGTIYTETDRFEITPVKDSLFSFVLVDSTKPPLKQKANKNRLWHYSLALTGMLGGLGLFEGITTLIRS